jgi:hypothetical protein
MADPVSMTIMAVGAATSAYGSVRQGQYASRVGRYNQQAAYAEAAQQEIQAGQEIAVASHNQQRIAARTRELLAEQTANAAAGGGSTQDATVQAVRAEAVKTSALDQLLEGAAAEERAATIRRGARVTRTQGDMARSEGQMKKQAGYIQAGSTLLQAGASWGDKFGWPGSK